MEPAPGSPRVSAPASRQLYIRTHGRRPRDEHDISEVFRRYGQIRYVRLMPHHDSGFVSYWRTRDACEAREALHARSVNGMNFDVQFSRSTRLLHIDAVPAAMPEAAVHELISSEFSRFGPLQSIEFSRHRGTVFITFQREEDAIQSVAALQGHLSGDWKWEIEFHKERTPLNVPNLEPHSSPPPITSMPPQPAARSVRLLENGHGPFSRASPPRSAVAAAAPPAPTPAPTPAPDPTSPRLSISRAQLAKRIQASASAKLADSTSQSQDARTPEQPPSVEDGEAVEEPVIKKEPIEATPPRNGSDAAPSQPARSRSRSPKPKQRRRSASPSFASESSSRSASPSDSDSSASSAESSRKRKKRTRSHSPAPVSSHACDSCEKLIQHWHTAHKERDIDVCKKIVAAWFKGNFEVIGEGDAPQGALVMRRSAFLQKELNPFLRSLGFRAWSSTSTLFTDWFLRELNGLTMSELRRQRKFRLIRRTSRAGYRDLLQSLLNELSGD